MRDIEKAKSCLEGHSVCLVKGGDVITDDARGIAPLMKLCAAGADLQGYSAADLIVGKAAAMLFARLGVTEVYGRVMSKAGFDFLRKSGIAASYGVLAEKIINRRGDGVCPMEATVAGIEVIDEAFEALKKTVERLREDKRKE